jgi:hypothetical protein
MMRSVAAAAVIVTLTSVTACGGEAKPPAASSVSTTTPTSSAASTSAPPQSDDYTRLLIDANDITAPEIFTAGKTLKNPMGQPGAATTFSNPDGTHVVGDTILVFPDAAAATAALESAKATQSKRLNGKPVAIDIGTGGTTVSGALPDGSKGVTVLMFTVDKAFTTLEFTGPTEALAPPDFVTDVGQKQATAIRNGLG